MDQNRKKMAKIRTKKHTLSIIVPTFNSASILPILYQRIKKAFLNTGLQWNVLFVDDSGENHATYKAICSLARVHSNVKGLRLSRNFGHAAAIGVGLRYAFGSFVAIMDDDMQDPPELLPQMAFNLLDGFDVVYGIRAKRPETGLRAFAYKKYYRVLSFFSGTKIPRDSGDFCVMRHHVVAALLSCETSQPFWRGLRAWAGFRQMGIPYARKKRLQGRSGYGIRKLLDLGLTGILTFSSIPLRVATFLGIGVGFLGVVFGAYAAVLKLSGAGFPPGFTATVVLLTLLGSAQLLGLGILGEYVWMLHQNVRRWPNAIVAETTFQKVR